MHTTAFFKTEKSQDRRQLCLRDQKQIVPLCSLKRILWLWRVGGNEAEPADPCSRGDGAEGPGRPKQPVHSRAPEKRARTVPGSQKSAWNLPCTHQPRVVWRNDVKWREEPPERLRGKTPWAHTALGTEPAATRQTTLSHLQSPRLT